MRHDAGVPELRRRAAAHPGRMGDPPAQFGSTSPSIAIGFSGSLYAHAPHRDATRVLKLDRAGRRVYSVEVPCRTSRVHERRMGGDADGNGYLLGYQDGAENSVTIYKLSPDGGRVAPIVRGKAEVGPLERTDVHMAVAADGTVTIVGERGLQVFDRGGALRVAWTFDE